MVVHEMKDLSSWLGWRQGERLLFLSPALLLSSWTPYHRPHLNSSTFGPWRKPGFQEEVPNRSLHHGRSGHHLRLHGVHLGRSFSRWSLGQGLFGHHFPAYLEFVPWCSEGLGPMIPPPKAHDPGLGYLSTPLYPRSHCLAQE